MAQSPIVPLIVGSHGAWLEVRSSPSDGACGVAGYPCRHPGVDVFGLAGTTVSAPESGVVVAAGDGTTAPFVGYGPWFIVVQGESGKFHMLGHLDPASAAVAPINAQITEGQPVGVTSAANHTHWEVRSRVYPDYANGQNNFTNNEDPLAWLSGAGDLATWLIVGGSALLIWLMWRRHL